MRLDQKTKILEALRSGRYKYGRQQIRTIDDCFCAWGVICDITPGVKWLSETPRGYWAELNGDSEQSLIFPPLSIRDHYGLDREQERVIALLSDTVGLEAAADFIERAIPVSA